MIAIPFSMSMEPGVYSVVLVLGEENLRRMEANDPAELNLTKFPPEYHNQRLHSIIITKPSEKDLAIVIPLIRAGKLGEAFKFLSRGWKDRPDLGDSDAQYRKGVKPS